MDVHQDNRVQPDNLETFWQLDPMVIGLGRGVQHPHDFPYLETPRLPGSSAARARVAASRTQGDAVLIFTVY